jgi:poly(3-hydroxybutyrate) depolymerase
MLPLVWLVAASAALATDLPAGQIIDRVTCAADSSQSYALYVPSGYTPSRVWPVIFAFDPGGRGRTPVERYQIAAERYGFIVVGSNNSRNGSTELPKILAAMTTDAAERLAVDPKRVYLAGMSGGARVALQVALASASASSKDVAGVAGVMASSAGYPDGRPRKTLPFPIFATAGTDDFNHLEMRQLDRALTTPHHLAIFKGGHVWLSSDLALEAVEWMELQAMKTGLKPRDDGEIDRLLAERVADVSGVTGRADTGRTDTGKVDTGKFDTTKVDKDTFLALQAIVDDFQGLRDVSAFAARATELGRDKSIRAALQKDRDEDHREETMLRDVTSLEAQLKSDDRQQALTKLRQAWKDLSTQAKQSIDSTERRLARRVLAALSADADKSDVEYLKIIAEYRVGRGGVP